MLSKKALPKCEKVPAKSKDAYKQAPPVASKSFQRGSHQGVQKNVEHVIEVKQSY